MVSQVFYKLSENSKRMLSHGISKVKQLMKKAVFSILNINIKLAFISKMGKSHLKTLCSK